MQVADYVLEVLPHMAPDAKPLECTQFAGDVMYVPRGWGHAILNMATSIGYALEFATHFQRY